MKIVFFGTPEFAAASLRKLVEAGCEVVGVVTTTDKIGGRGNSTLLESAVKKYALEAGLRILQPRNLKATDFLDELKSLNADLQIVVAFRMLPELVWAMPPMGTFNLHGSLLPKYRGAAPINWAIINGEKETGVTTFFLKHEIDTGDILFSEKIHIGPDDNAGKIHDQLMDVGAALVLKTVRAIEQGETSPKPQPNLEATHAPKLFLENTRLSPALSAQQAHDFVRGLSPYPGAWFLLDGQKVTVYKTVIEKSDLVENLGKIVSDNKNQIKIALKDGYLHIQELQLQGKKRLSTKDFLNGYKFTGNQFLL